jgi:hypothetical protein
LTVPQFSLHLPISAPPGGGKRAQWLFMLWNTELKSSLAQKGLENLEIGKTYMADRLRNDGTVIESALSHIYVSMTRIQKTTAKKWMQVPLTIYQLLLR